jgi:hypothetical protein
MSTNAVLRINNTVNDSTYVAQPSYYIDVDVADTLIFSAGSAIVANGEPIPSSIELNDAATALNSLISIEVAKYFLADSSANLLKEMFNAGSVDKRYVFVCSFDGLTVTEPQLEAWDDIDVDTYSIACLGSGIPTNSWYRAICTTDASPGTSWVGTPLAGNGISNVVLLNSGNGALTAAKDLYFNFKVLIPVGITSPSSYAPVLAITYMTN